MSSDDNYRDILHVCVPTAGTRQRNGSQSRPVGGCAGHALQASLAGRARAGMVLAPDMGTPGRRFTL